MFLSPLQVIEYARVRPGMNVADFGSGRGEYTFKLYDRLQGEGSVYAFDLEPEVIETLSRDRMRKSLSNFFPLCVDLNGHVPLKDALLHCAVLSNTLHALTEREQFLHELHRIMKPKGTVLFVDWASSFNNMGPTSERVVAPGEAVRLFKAHGFEVGDMIPAGSHHYAFVATRA